MIKRIPINSILPISRVKEISYKNHWLGVIPGILYGFGGGVICGIIGAVIELPNHSGKGEYQPVYALVLGPAIGTLIGIIAGWSVGNNYTYQFNP